jgi:thiosulfate dehydrogenase [quinone] large subunit
MQQVSLVLLRTLIGWHFLYEGYYKLMTPGWSADGQPLGPWSAAGYLKASSGPLAGPLRRMLDSGLGPWMDRGVKFGLLFVGLSLILGFATRLGCWGAIILLSLFYLSAIPLQGTPQPGNEGTYLLVNKNLIELVAVVTLLSFKTGRIAGLDMLLGRRRKKFQLTQKAEVTV